MLYKKNTNTHTQRNEWKCSYQTLTNHDSVPKTSRVNFHWKETAPGGRFLRLFLSALINCDSGDLKHFSIREWKTSSQPAGSFYISNDLSMPLRGSSIHWNSDAIIKMPRTIVAYIDNEWVIDFYCFIFTKTTLWIYGLQQFLVPEVCESMTYL